MEDKAYAKRLRAFENFEGIKEVITLDSDSEGSKGGGEDSKSKLNKYGRFGSGGAATRGSDDTRLG